MSEPLVLNGKGRIGERRKHRTWIHGGWHGRLPWEKHKVLFCQEAGPPGLGDFAVSSQRQSTQGRLLTGAVGSHSPQPRHHHKEPASNRLTRTREWRADSGLLNQGPGRLWVTCEATARTRRRMTYSGSGKERPLPLGSWRSAWPADPGWISSPSRLGWASLS